ncbi:MAG: nucleotidyltransferase domain-containing protein [Nanoarchaeota archaeon]
MEEINKLLLEIIKQKRLLSKLNFIILYGSFSQGKQTPLSDVDVCLSLSLDKKERVKLRLSLLSELPEKYDLQIFEDLPSYVQVEVLKGKFLYLRDQKKTTEMAFNLIREFEDFQRIYQYYISRNRAEAQL